MGKGDKLFKRLSDRNPPKPPDFIRSRVQNVISPPKIRVNSISPGGVFSNQPKDFVKNYEKKTPLNRMASPNDIKGITAYLSTDLSEYVTGQNFIIDGGWST